MATVDEAGRELLDLAMARPADARTRAFAELSARPSPREATYALHALGIVERDVGRMREAGRHLRRGLALARRHHLRDRVADMSATLGSVLAYAGRTAAAMAAFEEALAGSRGVDRGRVLVRRAAIRGLLLGDHEGAIEDGNKAIKILHRAGDALWESRAVGNRANSYVELGRLDKARADLERVAEMLDRLGQAYDAAITRHNLAMVSYAAGDLVGALRQVEQAIEEYEAVEAQVPEAYADRCLILLAAGLTAEPRPPVSVPSS